MRRVTFADWGYSLRRRNAAKNPNSFRIGSSQYETTLVVFIGTPASAVVTQFEFSIISAFQY